MCVLLNSQSFIFSVASLHHTSNASLHHGDNPNRMARRCVCERVSVCVREREREQQRETARDRERERKREFCVCFVVFFRVLPQSREICKGVHYGFLFRGCIYACVCERERTYSTSRNQIQLTESPARFFFFRRQFAATNVCVCGVYVLYNSRCVCVCECI